MGFPQRLDTSGDSLSPRDSSIVKTSKTRPGLSPALWTNEGTSSGTEESEEEGEGVLNPPVSKLDIDTQNNHQKQTGFLCIGNKRSENEGKNSIYKSLKDNGLLRNEYESSPKSVKLQV